MIANFKLHHFFSSSSALAFRSWSHGSITHLLSTRTLLILNMASQTPPHMDVLQQGHAQPTVHLLLEQMRMAAALRKGRGALLVSFVDRL
jgi:hypothetical protein